MDACDAHRGCISAPMVCMHNMELMRLPVECVAPWQFGLCLLSWSGPLYQDCGDGPAGMEAFIQFSSFVTVVVNGVAWNPAAGPETGSLLGGDVCMGGSGLLHEPVVSLGGCKFLDIVSSIYLTLSWAATCHPKGGPGSKADRVGTRREHTTGTV